jgi:hypothetical protein
MGGSECMLYVLGAHTPCDRRRVQVNHAIPNVADLVIGLIARANECAGHLRFEIVYGSHPICCVNHSGNSFFTIRPNQTN